MSKPWPLILLGSVLVLGLAGCDEKGEKKQPVTDTKTLIETKCSTCHFSSRIFDTERPARQWKAIVRRMHSKNPDMISREETKRIIKYLQETNSPPGEDTEAPAYEYDPEWEN